MQCHECTQKYYTEISVILSNFHFVSLFLGFLNEIYMENEDGVSVDIYIIELASVLCIFSIAVLTTERFYHKIWSGQRGPTPSIQ